MKPSDDLFRALNVDGPGFQTPPVNGAANALKVPLKQFLKSVEQKNFYHYYGSETTPPCAEGVQWAVYSDPLPIDPVTFKAFNDRVVMRTRYARNNGNSREVQPMNNRRFYFNDLGNKISSSATRLAATAVLGLGLLLM